MFTFTEVLVRLGYNPRRTMLLRHDDRGAEAWRRGRDAFASFASFQRLDRSPYPRDFDQACHFLSGPTLAPGEATALFVGNTRILDRWPWQDGGRLPAFQDELVIAAERASPHPLEAFDLEWCAAGNEFADRILIDWGPGIRSWFQRAERNHQTVPKPILELRREPFDPPFPGFGALQVRVNDVFALPQAWQAALSGVRGIYLLVTPQGRLYVGSATGAEGFIGRWRAYAQNGHGGNALLRDLPDEERDYRISILELASPDMSRDNIIGREAAWKDKLGSRAHGLNLN